MIRYKVKPERIAENEELVRAVYDELDRTAPSGLRYATFRLDDGASFVHIVSVETEDGSSPLRDINAFTRFQADVDQRVVERPVVSDMFEIGSYRLFER
jgi:hypothetical protein